MNYEEIKAKIDYLEDRVITNFETYFSYLVLEDFYTGGYKDRIEDEFFYEEYFSQYEDDIVNILLSLEGNSLEEHTDFKLRLIRMKRKIDTHLSKVNIEDGETKNHRQRRKNEFLLEHKLNKNKFIDFLYTQLKDNSLIDAPIEEFKHHFNDGWNNQIQWLGTELEITHLINILIDDKYLDDETHSFKYKLITSHFLNKNGNPFKEKQLSSVYAEKSFNIPNSISKIRKNIGTHFGTYQ